MFYVYSCFVIWKFCANLIKIYRYFFLDILHLPLYKTIILYYNVNRSGNTKGIKKECVKENWHEQTKTNN